MPTIYLKHRLVNDLVNDSRYDLRKREVYLSNISDLDKVLNLLTELMTRNPKFLFCLTWDGKSYYFEKDGTFIIMNEAPKSDISLDNFL